MINSKMNNEIIFFSIFETTDESIKMCYLAKSRQIFDDFRQISSKNVIWPNIWSKNIFWSKI